MNRKIKYGLIGGSTESSIGRKHKNAINFDERAELVAGCFSRNGDTNKAVGDYYNVEPDRVYGDYREMAEKEAARKDGIDFVSITTPNFTHFEIAREFLLNGINVVCEKPLCFEVDQAEELIKLAKEKDLVFAVTYTYSGYAVVKVMKEMIEEGKIGKVINVDAEYLQDSMLDQIGATDGSIWREDPKQAGISHVFGDIGTHIEYFVRYVTGLHIKKICAISDKFGHKLDINDNMLLEFDNGAHGTYWASKVAAGYLNGFTVRIFGDKGALEWHQQTPDYLKYTPVDAPIQIISRGAEYLTEKSANLSRLPVGHPEGLTIAFANHYRNIITTLIKKKNGEKPTAADLDFPTGEDGLEGIRFINAAVKSADSGSTWVEM